MTGPIQDSKILLCASGAASLLISSSAQCLHCKKQALDLSKFLPPASAVEVIESECTLTTLTRNSWSNVGQNLVNRPTFDYALFGEHLTKVLVISWS